MICLFHQGLRHSSGFTCRNPPFTPEAPKLESRSHIVDAVCQISEISPYLTRAVSHTAASQQSDISTKTQRASRHSASFHVSVGNSLLLCKILQQHPFSVTIFSSAEPNISTHAHTHTDAVTKFSVKTGVKSLASHQRRPFK